MAGEAQRVLRAFPTQSSEKEGRKKMPSFPDMVAYVQEKVRFSAYFQCFWRQYTGLRGKSKLQVNYVSHIFLILSLSGSSEDQDSS